MLHFEVAANMMFEQIPVGELENFSYLVADEENKMAAVIDPAGNVSKILDVVKRRGLLLKYIINTHAHYDHVSGNDLVALKTGARVVMHAKSTLRKDVSVQDGDVIDLGNVRIKVIHTPGHTPESICLIVNGILITGDTLFIGECGRTDLPGGNSNDMYDSLFGKLTVLDGNLMVYPGHNYGNKPCSKLQDEIKTNYTLKPRSREEFIRFMSEP